MTDEVNPQITDPVTQASVKVVAEAPAYAMGTIYQSLAQSTGLMFANAVNTQNDQNILLQAAAAQGVIQIYSLDSGGALAALVKAGGAPKPGGGS